MSKSQSKLKLSSKEANFRGADLTNTLKQRFREEVLAKENLGRIKLYMNTREARNDGSAPVSRQCDVFKGRAERGLPQPQDRLLELAHKHPLSEHQHKLKKVDAEKMALKRVEGMVVDECVEGDGAGQGLYMRSNAEYGWWLEGDAGADVAKNGGRGRKNVIGETFYRRNGVGSCMAV